MFFLNECCVLVFYVLFLVMRVCLCTGHFVMVPLNLTGMYIHWFQHSFFGHLFNLYYYILVTRAVTVNHCIQCSHQWLRLVLSNTFLHYGLSKPNQHFIYLWVNENPFKYKLFQRSNKFKSYRLTPTGQVPLAIMSSATTPY